MKHHILLSVTIPREDSGEQIARWHSLQQRLEALAKTTKDIVVLAPNAWLILRDTGMPFVSECVAVANRYEIAHRIWFLDEEI